MSLSRLRELSCNPRGAASAPLVTLGPSGLLPRHWLGRGTRHGDHRIDEGYLGHPHLAVQKSPEHQAELELLGGGKLCVTSGCGLRDTDILGYEMERREKRDVDRAAHPETVAGGRLYLREQLIAKVISRNKQRAYKEDGRHDDDEGRKQRENESHGPLRWISFN